MPGMCSLSGVLSTLALLYKQGKRDDLIGFGGSNEHHDNLSSRDADKKANN